MTEPLPSDNDQAARRAVTVFAEKVKRRWGSLGEQSKAWSQAIQHGYEPHPVVDPTIAKQSALGMARRIGAPRVVRDRKAWEIADAPLMDANSTQPASSQVVDPPARSVVSNPLSASQPASIVPQVPVAVRFHRSLLRAIDAPVSELPASRSHAPTPMSNRPPQPEEALWNELDQKSSHPIAHEVRERLADSLQGALPDLADVRIHDDATAGEIVRMHNADAVSNRNRVAFRLGSFQPETPQGLSLLGHELIHVARAGDSTSATERRREEHQALSTERELLGQPPLPWPTPAASPVVSNGHENTASRAAATQRPIDPPMDPVAATLTESQIRELKQQIYRDLVDKIRVEFERGEVESLHEVSHRPQCHRNIPALETTLS